MVPGSPTLTARALVPIQAALHAAGCDPASILSRAGIHSAVLDFDGRITAEQFERVWAEAVRASGCEDFGLVAGAAVDFSNFDVLAYLTKTSATLREAHDRASRYVELLTDSLKLTLEERGPDATVTLVGPPTRRAIVEFRIALWVRVARIVLGNSPVFRIHVRHPAPRDLRSYLSTLGTVPRFSTTCDAIVFPAALLDVPLPGADPALCAILEREADRILARLQSGGSVSRAVRLAIAAEVDRGEVSLERTAARLGMAARTLRRHLQREGTRHRSLLDDVRRNLAELYLDDHGLGVAEVASRLGFADPSAFSKAFRRWTGKSPRGR